MIVNKYPYVIAPSGPPNEQQFAAFNLQTHQPMPFYHFQHPGIACSTMPPPQYAQQQQQHIHRYPHPPPIMPTIQPNVGQVVQENVKLNATDVNTASSAESTSPISLPQSPGLVHKQQHQQQQNMIKMQPYEQQLANRVKLTNDYMNGSEEDRLNKSDNRKNQRSTQNMMTASKKRFNDRVPFINNNNSRNQSNYYQQTTSQNQFHNSSNNNIDSNRNLYLNTPPPSQPSSILAQQINLSDTSRTLTPPPPPPQPPLLPIPAGVKNSLDIITNQKVLNNMKQQQQQQMSPNVNSKNNNFKNDLSKQQQRSNSASPLPNYNLNNFSNEKQQIAFINSALPLTALFNPATGQYVQPGYIDMINENNNNMYVQQQAAINNDNNNRPSNGVSTASPAPTFTIPSNYLTYPANQSQYFNLIPILTPNFGCVNGSNLNNNNNNTNGSNTNANNSNNNNNVTNNSIQNAIPTVTGPHFNIIQTYPAQHFPSYKYAPPAHMYPSASELPFMTNHMIDNSFINENNSNYIKSAHNTFQKKKSCYNCGMNHMGSECREPTFDHFSQTSNYFFSFHFFFVNN